MNQDEVSINSSKSNLKQVERRKKLQRYLILRAFNLRQSKETLFQQFYPLATDASKGLHTPQKHGKLEIEISTLCSYLNLSPIRRIMLLQALELPLDAIIINFQVFIHFLQSGALEAAKISKSSLEEGNNAEDTEIVNSGVLIPYPSQMNKDFIRHDSRPPPTPGLWKKREITIQERITEYTKIDVHGKPQTLVEKEKHQTEVIHMEAIGGEFAHREITQFETIETLNDEIVHQDTGREEFFHLKSKDDEISRFESSIPHTQREECENPPPSPKIKQNSSQSSMHVNETTVNDTQSNNDISGWPEGPDPSIVEEYWYPEESITDIFAD